MKSKITGLLLLLSVLVMMSCRKENTAIADSSMVSLDWSGYYQGVIPKHDNKGVYTDIELKEDSTFVKRTKTLGSEEELTKIFGTFTWAKDGNSIVLESDFESKNSILRVQENRLVWQNLNGLEIKESDRESFVLTKIPGILLEREWVIRKMSDSFVNIVPMDENDAINIHFSSDENMVYGYGGCNYYRASYHLIDNELSFTPILSTMMAGPNLELENKFFNILNETRQYEIAGNELYFMDAKGLHLMVAEVKVKKD